MDACNSTLVRIIDSIQKKKEKDAPWWVGTFTHGVKGCTVDTPWDCSVMRYWMRVLQLASRLCVSSERIGTVCSYTLHPELLGRLRSVIETRISYRIEQKWH